MKEFRINNEPSADELWAGIGGNFDSLSQIICEFVDNAISNFNGNDCDQKNIRIVLTEEGRGVKIVIEDSGTGIKNLDQAFTLGSRACAESTYNEHGFGMKHALASANPENNHWSIYTRTESDIKKRQFRKISHPYKISDFKGEILPAEKWPKEGAFFGQTGTIIEFMCSRDMFNSLARGIKGGVTNFKTLCDLLYEDLGYIYSYVLYKQLATIQLVIVEDNQQYKYSVEPILPKWEKDIKIGPDEGVQDYDLGNGRVRIDYHFGAIKDSGKAGDGRGGEINRTLFNNDITRKYYRRNMASSGVELRFNGRLMCSNLFKEIWGIEKHNAYNYLLIVINLETDDIKALPETRTSKNGLREGDEKLEKLYEWIKKNLTEPRKNLSDTEKETDLFEALEKIKKSQLADFQPLVVEREKYVFGSTGTPNDRERIDLYVSCKGDVTIYEGKIEETSAKDVYQLRMYWDGLVYENIHPKKGIIIAKEHSSGVKNLIKIINSMKDQSGSNYNFECKTWEDETVLV